MGDATMSIAVTLFKAVWDAPDSEMMREFSTGRFDIDPAEPLDRESAVELIGRFLVETGSAHGFFGVRRDQIIGMAEFPELGTLYVNALGEECEIEG